MLDEALAQQRLDVAAAEEDLVARAQVEVGAALGADELADVLRHVYLDHEVLRRLDHRVIAKQKWRDVSEPRWLPRIPGISADGFLYARCAAVLQGPEAVAGIVEDPRRFRTRWDDSAEALLYVAGEAWEAVTGRTYEHQSPINYETGRNPDGGWR